MMRRSTRSRICRTHGRTSSYVTSDIGPMPVSWWHRWHARWKMGATSALKVGPLASAGDAIKGTATAVAAARTMTRFIAFSSNCQSVTFTCT